MSRSPRAGRRRRAVTVAAVCPLAAATLAMLAGCGQGGVSQAADQGAPQTRSSCVLAPSPTPLPASFPKFVPIPSSAVVTAVDERTGGPVTVTASSGSGFGDTLAFMQRMYPQAGLTLKDDKVQGQYAESAFTGNGLAGRWTVKEIPDCPGDVVITVQLTKA